MRHAEHGGVGKVVADHAPESGLGARVLRCRRFVEAHDAAAHWQEERAGNREELALADRPVSSACLELRAEADSEECRIRVAPSVAGYSRRMWRFFGGSPVLGAQQAARSQDALEVSVAVQTVGVEVVAHGAGEAEGLLHGVGVA